MFPRRWLKSLTVFVGLVAAVGLQAGSAGAISFGAALLKCSTITQPAHLSSCGSDPLTAGIATIDDFGDVDVQVSGASPGQTYGVVFRSPNGSASDPIDTLTTDSSGNGSLRMEGLFAFNSAGAGNVVLTRNSSDQYVTGVTIVAPPTPSTARHVASFAPGLELGLVRCAAVSVPAALAGCGTDPLARGSLDLEGFDGTLLVQLHGAAAGQTYTVTLQSPVGSSLTLGILTTNAQGSGTLTKTAAIAVGSIVSGTVIVQRGGSNEFLSGFQVTAKPFVPTISQANLFTCADVNDPATLSNCGMDSLMSGAVQVNAGGLVKVAITGAEASASYEVFFRPIDSTGSTDVDTGLALTTDTNGNASASATFFKSGNVASGNFVVKRSGLDQFLTGFEVR